jgi:DNA polymerase-3 subunit delta
MSMSTIRNDDADSFARRPPADMRFFLVHGNDEGLIHERARALVDALLAGNRDPLMLTRIEGETLARDPGRLADEAYAVSMFPGQRVIWIDAGERDLTARVEPLLASPPRDTALVVESGSLKKGSAFRGLFERSGLAASIECYPDERGALVAMIDAEARLAGLEVTREARDFLLTLLGSDRMTSRGEITKLMLYARGDGQVGIAHVEAIVSDAAPSSLDALIDAALLGRIADVEHEARQFFGHGGDAQYLLIRLIARMKLLHVIRLEVDGGKSVESAMQGLFIRLPFASRAALVKQAEMASSATLGKRLQAMLGVAARARRSTKLGPAIATRALWTLASGTRARR